jgi:acetyl esterase/lipase
MLSKLSLSLLAVALFSTPLSAAEQSGGKTKITVHKDVAYGPDARNRLDFWVAPGKGPRPVVVFIHGGGWLNGDKRSASASKRKTFLAAGISYAAINYRLASKHPLPAPVHDAARAIQFIRFKAREWNVNVAKIAVMGGSAGGCTSLWLLLHDDLGNKNAKDPVLRQSTRVCAAVVGSGQTSIDPKVITEWIGPKVLDHAMIFKSVGGRSKKEILDNYAKYQKLFKEFSPINHLDKNDPPLLLQYGKDLPANTAGRAIHHLKFGLKMKEASDKVGHQCYLYYPGAEKQKYRYTEHFLKSMLLGEK